MSVKNKGLTFKASFYQKTAHQPTVWDTVDWETRQSAITASDGKKIFEMENIEVPSHWSQLATDIAASKYFRKAGVQNEVGYEHSVKELVHRIAQTLAEEGYKRGYFETEADQENFGNDLKWLLIHQYGAFNSPVWFNLGLFHQYGIKSRGENYAWDYKDSFKMVENQFERPQCSACFIQSIDDDLGRIFELVKNEAKLFKYGSGTGTNMSRLRGAEERLSGGGKSSGLLSFLKVLDSAAGAIKSGGTTRRAAVMRCLDADHPEFVDFIEWKVNEEAKARALISQGYSSDFNGEAYGTVSGQNSNNSVRLSDDFMRAVENDKTWETTFRTTGEVYKTYKAKWLYEKICSAAWECADPGVQFDTTINDWHTCSGTDPIRASNPCSEFMFIDDSACNLASLNLARFYKNGKFMVDQYKAACRIFLVAQDILVDFSSYPTERITRNSHEYRPLGLGYANLGTLLMMTANAYDSDKGRSISGLITAIMTGHAYEVSAELAKSKGTFKGFKKNKSAMMKVIKKHHKALDYDFYKHIKGSGHEYLAKEARKCWDKALEMGEIFGYRNAQVSVLAPTGTIGLLMDCATTGVEPAFSLVMWKKLAGGGVIPIVNHSVPMVLNQLGYSKEQIVAISDHITQNTTIEGAADLKDEHLPIFDCAMSSGTGSRFIEPMGHVKMMAAVQPFISGAISKTINVPSESSVEDIEKIYMKSWKLGVKAITIYRDGSKSSQPLNTAPSKEDKADLETIEYLKKEIERLQQQFEAKQEKKTLDWGNTKKLPNCRGGRTWEFKVQGTKIFLRSGENPDGSLGEIFVDLGYKEGSTVRALMNQFAISISFSLQHGVPLEKLVERFSFTKFEPHGRVEGHPYLKNATSLVDAIFRVLGHHYLGRVDFLQVKPTTTTDSEETEEREAMKEVSTMVKEYQPEKPVATNDHIPCSECGGIEFLRTGTCFVCITCGASQGCS